ncbi:hypothetical protein N7486_010010 [Penicillium sp. IBT 16267x]|nr:hypothetical protein N7486_010010 [Penicillium sp. IBT 16267x]
MDGSSSGDKFGAYVDPKNLVGELIQSSRWLYSSCLECDICEVNHTACPNQRNAGAVRYYSLQLPISACMPRSYAHLTIQNVPGTFQRQYIHTPGTA